MTVSVQDVRHVAALARLAITDEGAESMAAELSKILEHMDVLGSVDTQGVEEAVGIGAEGMPLRSDSSPRIPMEHALYAIAPELRDGLLLVPRLSSHESPAAP